MGVAVQKTRAGVPVHFPKVSIVAKPEHEVWPLLVDRGKYLIITAIGFARAVVGIFVHVSAAAHCHLEIGWVSTILPKRLGLELGRVIELHGLVVDA